MKSQQSENEVVKTSCKNCVFAQYDCDTQINCLAGRIGAFGFQNITEAYDNDKEFYVINRLCNYYRDKDLWNNGVADVDKVRAECQFTFDIFLNCDNIDEATAKSYINWWNSLSVDKNKVNVYLYNSPSVTLDQRKLISSVHKVTNKYLIVSYDHDETLHSHVSKSRSAYHYNGEAVPTNLIEITNRHINDELLKLVMFVNNHRLVVSNVVYKIESFRNQCYSYRDNISLIKDLSQKENLFLEESDG